MFWNSAGSASAAGNAKSILAAGLSLHIAAVAFHAIAGVLGQPGMACGQTEAVMRDGLNSASLRCFTQCSWRGYFLAALSGSDERERRTVAIEIAGSL